MEPAPPTPLRNAGTPANGRTPTPRAWGWIAAGYFGLQVLLRVASSGTADLDEAEQLLATQCLQWGYGPQPPLYTWLAWPLIQLFGPGILPLALLKNLLLFGILAFTYASALDLTGNPRRSALAAVSAFFLPQFAWEAQRDLTHSVLVTLLAAATLWAFLRLLRHPGLPRYAVLGLCLAAGCLSKYSFLLLAAGLLVGALTLPSGRVVLLHRGSLVTLGVVLVLLAPHLVWAGDQARWVLATSHKLGLQTDQPWIEVTLKGWLSLAGGAAANLGALVAVYLVVAGRRPAGAAAPGSPLPEGGRVLQRALLGILVLAALSVLLFDVTRFKVRWFLPLCIWMPVLLVLAFGPRLTLARTRALTATAGLVALVILVALPSRVWFASSLGRARELNAPFATLASALQSARSGPLPPLLIAGNNWVGGNLKIRFPDRWVLTPQLLLHTPVTAGATALIVWDGRRHTSPPATLVSWVNRFAEIAPGTTSLLQAPMRFAPASRMTLGWATATLTNPPVNAR